MAKNTPLMHDINAIRDPKIQKLIEKKGLVAYGFYWCVLEYMANNNGYVTIDDLSIIARICWLKPSLVRQLFDALVECELVVNSASSRLQLVFNSYSTRHQLDFNSASTRNQNCFISERLLLDLINLEKKRETYRNNINRRWQRNNSNGVEENKGSGESNGNDTTEIQLNKNKNTIVASYSCSCSCSNSKERLQQVEVKKQSEPSLSPDGQNALFPPKPDTEKTDFFLILKDGQKANVDGKWLDAKKALFKGMDIENELRKMSSWLDDNPMKRPMNWKRFAGSWLNRAWDDCRKQLTSQSSRNNNSRSDYGMARTSNSDWEGEKGGLIEF